MNEDCAVAVSRARGHGAPADAQIESERATPRSRGSATGGSGCSYRKIKVGQSCCASSGDHWRIALARARARARAFHQALTPRRGRRCRCALDRRRARGRRPEPLRPRRRGLYWIAIGAPDRAVREGVSLANLWSQTLRRATSRRLNHARQVGPASDARAVSGNPCVPRGAGRTRRASSGRV
jgi:hypothetical protein